VRRLKLDLRQRIALAFALACTAVVAALGLTLRTASEEMEEALVYQIVSEEVDHLIDRYRKSPDYLPAPGPNLQYYIVRSGGDGAGVPPEFLALGPGNHEIGSGSNERHVAVRHVDNVRFIVTYDSGQHEEREAAFGNLLLLSLATVILVAIALGYWLGGVLTRQLTDLAQRVSRLAPDEPHDLLAHPGQDAEIGALARTLDEYHARIMAMVEREQEFTANASHELRTPLTAIRTSCELLLGEPLPDKARARVSAIDAAARRMGDQVQALLFLAREQPPGAAESVDLTECVDEAAAALHDEMAAGHVAFENRVAAGTVLKLDPPALHTVLANLLRNAVQHTERGFIRVSYGEHRLTVADSGTGIEARDLPRLFDRFYRGANRVQGLGLGLAIVKRICDWYGWRIDVDSAPGRGSAFTIAFPKRQ
jgi:signal transduction histidine kinase